MNTFVEMRKKLLEFYVTSLDSYPLTEDEDDDIKSEREKIVVDSIKNMDSEERYKLLSLLVLHFYSYVIVNDQEEELKDDEFLNLVLNKDKDYVIDELLNDCNTYLYDIISLYIDTEISIIEEDDKISDGVDEFEHYLILDDAMKEERFMDLYKKYHPNTVLEDLCHREYLFNNNILKKCKSFCPRNLTEFIEIFSVIRKKFTRESYVEKFIYTILNNISLDKEVRKKINLFMLRDFYLKKLVCSVNDKTTKYTIYNSLANLYEVNDEVVESFLDFDINRSIRYYSFLNDLGKEEIDKMFNFDTKKSYGVEGAWKEYNDSQEESIMRYSPSWINNINYAIEAGNKVLVYYSINENDCYSIPRICLIVNKENNVINFLGRETNNSIELELLKTIDVHLRKYSNYDVFKDELTILNYISNIDRKISRHEDLTKEEIGFLFELDCIFDYDALFDYYDQYLSVRNKADKAKCFSIYYGCKREEVACYASDLNENTVVSAIDNLVISDDKKYPKLRIVYGNLDASNLSCARGLSSLECVYGNANFESLVSSYGLENLSHITGDVVFTNLRDFSHLNRELFDNSSIIFPDDNDSRGSKK